MVNMDLDKRYEDIQEDVLGHMNGRACSHRDQIYMLKSSGWVRASVQALKEEYKKVRAPVKVNGRWWFRKAGKWWLDHPFRQRVDKVVDDPDLPSGIHVDPPDEPFYDTVLNLYWDDLLA
jgi:hypothetical protein